MEQTGDNIVDIIGKQLNGTASAAELRALELWLEADPLTNRAEYEAFVKIWEESGQLPADELFDVRAAWEKVDRTIRGRRGVRPWPRLLAAAAVVVLLAGGFWLFKTTNTGTIQTVATDNQVVHLPDGSVVTLRKGAVLTFNRDEASFRGARSVQLRGQAFFDVRADSRSAFTVQTDRAAILVLGTSFFVNETGDSVRVTVTTGRVRFTDKGSANGFVELSGNESAELVSHRFIRDTAVTNDLAWQTGVFDFRYEPLDRVVVELNSYFGDSVALSRKVDSAASTIHINAHFDKESLSGVLEEIELTTGLTGKEEDHRIVLYYK